MKKAKISRRALWKYSVIKNDLCCYAKFADSHLNHKKTRENLHAFTSETFRSEDANHERGNNRKKIETEKCFCLTCFTCQR